MPPATTTTTQLYSVCVTQTGERYDCRSSESLLQGMLRLGRKGIPAGCTNGGCGVCKVRIVSGSVRLLGPVSRAHVSASEQSQGYTLACRAAPESPVQLQVCARLSKPFSPSCNSFSPPVAAAPAPAAAAARHHQPGD